MELVQRYIAAVQRELPEAKRDEIGRELKANIMDQLDAMAEQQGTLSDTDVAALLKSIGHPRAVAQQFVPLQPLISASYMPLYKNTLFMVLGILFLLQVVDSTSDWLGSQMGLLGYLHSLASGFIGHAIFAFTAVTLGFWSTSRFEPKAQNSCQDKWHPEKLPKVGPAWQHISLEDIFTDLATYLFLLIVIWYPLWMSADVQATSRFLFSTEAHLLLKWASPLVLLGLANSLWQLRTRLWSRNRLLANIGVNAGFVISILLLATTEPLLALDSDIFQDVFTSEQLQRTAVYGLVITAMFPLWEVLRDSLRLGKLG